MSNIVRAWKDETYRQSLSVEEQSMLPANPAGEIELTETDLEAISGAFGYQQPSSDFSQPEAEQKAPFSTNGPINILGGAAFAPTAATGNQFGECFGNNDNQAEAQ